MYKNSFATEKKSRQPAVTFPQNEPKRERGRVIIPLTHSQSTQHTYQECINWHQHPPEHDKHP